ncbi:hypothetical protein HDV00_007773 [Rhizophlyctis rosea]|nr:hypothetical protein HDV00_007773 [Rhizophlyctis rosea]
MARTHPDEEADARRPLVPNSVVRDSGYSTITVHSDQEDDATQQSEESMDFHHGIGHRHYSDRTPWLRAAVLGANDGLVSVAALMLGVGGGNADQKTMILAGVASLVAGALSMACGEYVSVSSQKDTEHADMLRERQEFLKGPEAAQREMEELACIYEAKGLSKETAQIVAKELHERCAGNVDAIVKVHMRDELNVDLDEMANPVQAAVTSAIMFSIGALFPLLGE